MNGAKSILRLILPIALMALGIGAMIAPPATFHTMANALNAASSDLGARLPWITGGAAGVIIGLLFLLFELREASPRAAARIAVAGGEAELPIAAIAERLQREMLKVPDVRQASAQVSPRGQRVDVTLVLYTSAATSVPATASEAVRLAREALETSLGLQVGHLGVRIEPTTQPEEAPPPSSGSEASAD